MMTNQVILALVINRLHVCVAFCKLLASCLEMQLRQQMAVEGPVVVPLVHDSTEPFAFGT